MKVRVTDKEEYIVCIPKALAKAKELKHGDNINWYVGKDGNLILQKV